MITRIYSSIEEVGENKWNSIVGRNRIICTYNYLLAVEKSNINDCRYFYPVIYDENDKIIAHTCVYSITVELDTLTGKNIKRIIKFIRKFWKKFLTLKFIECGTPVELGNTISFAEGINKKQALNLLVQEIENISKLTGINIILIRDFYDNEIYFFDSLILDGYKKVINLPNTILKIKWDSFNDYLDSLRSHYRYKLLKNINKIKKNSITIEINDSFSCKADEIHSLWKNVYANAKEYKREILSKKFFVNIDKFLDKKSKVIFIKKDLKIIGYALLLMDDDTLRFMYTGLDYNYNNEFSIYFNSIYEIIRIAINERKSEIDFGISTYIPKMKVGAIIENLNMYIKHSNILLSPILATIFTFLTPKIKIKAYNIFKPNFDYNIKNSNELVYQKE